MGGLLEINDQLWVEKKDLEISLNFYLGDSNDSGIIQEKEWVEEWEAGSA